METTQGYGVTMQCRKCGKKWKTAWVERGPQSCCPGCKYKPSDNSVTKHVMVEERRDEPSFTAVNGEQITGTGTKERLCSCGSRISTHHPNCALHEPSKTLRDEFAMAAMNAELLEAFACSAIDGGKPEDIFVNAIARNSYRIADAMLEARKQ